MVTHMFNATCQSFGIDTKKTYTISLSSYEDSTVSHVSKNKLGLAFYSRIFVICEQFHYSRIKDEE